MCDIDAHATLKEGRFGRAAAPSIRVTDGHNIGALRAPLVTKAVGRRGFHEGPTPVPQGGLAAREEPTEDIPCGV